MSKRIYKFTLSPLSINTMELPYGAEVLDVQIQHGSIRLWALGDFNKTPVRREFLVTGTGMDVPDDADYVATVQMDDGARVWHVFEIPTSGYIA